MLCNSIGQTPFGSCQVFVITALIPETNSCTTTYTQSAWGRARVHGGAHALRASLMSIPWQHLQLSRSSLGLQGDQIGPT